MRVQKITAVLLVNAVEPCVEFWVKRFGFQLTLEVPNGDRLGFAILQSGTVELMYQSYASLAPEDLAAAEAAGKGPTYLYVEVDDLDATKAAAEGVPQIMPERKTFYGSREVGYRDPGGHSVTFAQFGD